jgi:3-carboxy-cis,cis-muconate cycloisomerase
VSARRGAASLFASDKIAALFTSEAQIQRMLDVEAALARAAAGAGAIPPDAAEEIAGACKVELFEVDRIYKEAATAGTPVVPLVRRLTEAVDDTARAYVHFGATSQDILDTAMGLGARAALELLEDDLVAAGRACATLAQQHRTTLMAGRTLLQHALPITFGLKAAGWLDAITRSIVRLHGVRERELVLQFGGAAGTLASLGDAGPKVEQLLADHLGLPVPALAWHAARDRVAALAGFLTVTAAAVAKISTDVLLMTQTEIDEVAEGAAPGKGVSSAMPHKRNPTDTIAARAAASLASSSARVVLDAVHEHERAAGDWQAEWVALPDAMCYTAGAIERVRTVLENLKVDSRRMSANLELSRGLVMTEALAIELMGHMERQEAQNIVASLSVEVQEREGTLLDVAAADARVNALIPQERLQEVLTAERYLGSSNAFIDRALAAFERATTKSP